MIQRAATGDSQIITGVLDFPAVLFSPPFCVRRICCALKLSVGNAPPRGWNWISCQLDDINVQITSAVLCDTSEKKPIVLDKAAIIVDQDGNAQRYNADDHKLGAQ